MTNLCHSTRKKKMITPGWAFYLNLYLSFEVTFGYDNLSSFQKATQSSRNNDTNVSPARAVDRHISTCSSTGPDNPAWWYVDLQGVKSIHDIRIYFNGIGTSNEQRQRGLMYGYQLYVSNTTDVSSLDNARLCYNNSGPHLPDLIVTHLCISFGRYIIFYNERLPGVTYPSTNGVNQNFTSVQLCELSVNGCAVTGTYGQNCFNTCPTHCQEQRCYITNGTCVGCTDGWTGTQCNIPCAEGYYGLECRGVCSNNCLNNRTCNHVTGICDNGCSDGWTGRRCNITCVLGTYGVNCSQNCSGNCLNGTSCNKVTGICDNECTSGYTGEGCNQVCTPGTYGAGCTENCSGKCTNGTSCNTVTGNCDEGCSPGYTEDKCDQECPSGSFGVDCRNNCSGNCWNNETCRNVDGRCIHGCKPGFQGVFCDNICSKGYYGKECKLRCSGHCGDNTTCYHKNGFCLNGCQDRYWGKRCEEHCIDIKEHESDVNGTLAGLASVSAISLLLNVAFIVFLFHLFRRGSKNDSKNAEPYESRISSREQGDAHVYQELQHQNSTSQVYQNLS